MTKREATGAARGTGGAPPILTVFFAGVLALASFAVDVAWPQRSGGGLLHVVPLAFLAWRGAAPPRAAAFLLATLVGVSALLHLGAVPRPGAWRWHLLGLGGLGLAAGLLELRRRAQSARDTMGERYRAVLETAVDAIITIDARGCVLDCNRATETLLGYSRRELVGQNIKMLMPEPHCGGHDGYLRRYLETGESRIIGVGREVEARRKDGTRVPVDLAVSELVIDGERAFTGILRDISARKRAENALEAANRSLVEKNRELQSIVYVASHDLRSPLVNIHGFSRELAASCEDLRDLAREPGLPPEFKQRLEQIVVERMPEDLDFVTTSAKKMDALLEGLLRLSRLGRAELSVRRVELSALVDEVAKSMEYQFKQEGAELIVGALPSVDGDETQLAQVFSNLFDNALKYRVLERPPEIRVSAAVEETQVRIAVEDNGIGIAPSHRAKVFEIFHRLSASREGGEGLGLTIAQRVVSRHGGAIWVEGAEGPGCRFVFTLPAALEEGS